MQLTFRDNYWSDPVLKRTFIQFLIASFRLDLSLWDSMGFWDDNYRPFSLFDGDKLVSSLCLYSMPMTIDGQPCLAGQFSAVATHPDYRRRGLSAQLMRRAAEWAANTHSFFFLFANEGAFPFYAHCGYRRITEFRTRLSVTGRQPLAGLVKLDVNNVNDIELIYRHATTRAPVSDVLGVHCPRLFMFWCLYGLRDNIYRIPELDVLILCGRKDGILSVYDVVGATTPPFAKIYPYIAHPGDQAVEFLFIPDKLRLPSAGELITDSENGTHISGRFPLEHRPLIFPFTAHA